ncbi:MAG TPA: beta-galactosidase [Ktedonobacterales bacterium]
MLSACPRLALITGAFLAALLVGGCGVGAHGTLMPTVGQPAMGRSQLKGIFQFTGTPMVDNPDLTGGVVIHYWSELEPEEGQFNWAPLDQDIALWVSHGKKVVVRIPFSSSFHNKNATPQWVYNLGVRSVTEVDGAIHPQYWNPIFLAKLHDFISAFGARYDGNPNLVFIDAAVGNDGETIVDNNGPHSHTSVNTSDRLALWQAVGYTDDVWWTYIQTVLGYYASSFHKTPMAVQVVATFIGGTKGYNAQKVLAYAAQHGFWLQDDAEAPTKSTLDPLWHGSTLVLEPGENSYKQGSTLMANLQNIIQLQAEYAFVFGSDLKDQAGQQALHWAAAQEVH